MRQKRLNFAGTHVARMAHGSTIARPSNEKTYPIDVHLLGAEAIVHVPDTLAQLVQYTSGLERRAAGFHGIFIAGRPSSILNYQPSCKPLSGGIHGPLMEQRPSYRAGFALDITLNRTKQQHDASFSVSSTADWVFGNWLFVRCWIALCP